MIKSAKLFKQQEIKSDFGNENIRVNCRIWKEPKSTNSVDNGQKVYCFESDNGLSEAIERYAEYHLEFNNETINTGSIQTNNLNPNDTIYLIVTVNRV